MPVFCGCPQHPENILPYADSWFWFSNGLYIGIPLIATPTVPNVVFWGPFGFTVGFKGILNVSFCKLNPFGLL